MPHIPTWVQDYQSAMSSQACRHVAESTDQFVLKLVALLDKDPPGNRQVAVKPGVPKPSTICLNIDCEVIGLHAFGDRLELQAWTAANMQAGCIHNTEKMQANKMSPLHDYI